MACDAAKKQELLACHPYLDATSFCKRHFGKAIAYEPETYVACGKQEHPAAPRGRVAITGQLAADFLGFWFRKLRAQVAG